MIDVKQAVETGVRYLRELPGIGAIADIKLEEVELTENEHEWIITLSYREVVGGVLAQTKYKVFRIDASTGRVLSMKIRTLA